VQSDIVDTSRATAIPLTTKGCNPGTVSIAVVFCVVYRLCFGFRGFKGAEDTPIAGSQDLDLAIGAGGEEFRPVWGEEEGGWGVEVIVEGTEVAVTAGKGREGRDGGWVEER